LRPENGLNRSNGQAATHFFQQKTGSKSRKHLKSRRRYKIMHLRRGSQEVSGSQSGVQVVVFEAPQNQEFQRGGQFATVDEAQKIDVLLVGAEGFEPPTLFSQSRSDRLWKLVETE
jgi:hypothetical protein